MMNKYVERIYNGVWKENPSFVQMLGLCPTLAVTTSAINGIGMGLSTTVVLIAANIVIAALRNLIPERVRLPGEIVVVASMVTVVDMLMEGFTPDLYKSLGIYIPLIVVNCIILGRAEAFASKNGVFDSALDGLGMGLGYTVSIILMSAIRQIIATGILSFDNPFDAAQNIFSIRIIPEDFAISMFSQPFGAFCTFACLAAGLAAYKSHQQNKAKKLEKEAK